MYKKTMLNMKTLDYYIHAQQKHEANQANYKILHSLAGREPRLFLDGCGLRTFDSRIFGL